MTLLRAQSSGPMNVANKSYPPGTILGTRWGLFEVREDGSRKPVFASEVEGRPRIPVGDFGTSYVDELRVTVTEILDEQSIEYKDGSQEWLQKWWAVRVRALLDQFDDKGK